MEEANIYLNGSLIGTHENPDELTEEIREKRRREELPKTLTVGNYQDEVHINTDTGRALRPVIVVEDGEPKLTEEHKNKIKNGEITFKDLLKNGIVEYLDAEEEENAYIAMKEEQLTEEHTHLEIHPSLAFGVCSNINPFPEHNLSQRVEKSDSVAKQSMGLYASNFNIRTDTEGYFMFYPQQPITRPKYNDLTGLSRRPAGVNFTIAVMPFEGYNINDAIVINKGSVERAIARGTYLRTYTGKERRYPGGQKDKFEKPDEAVTGYRGEEAYKHLDEDGVIEPETEVEARDVLIGKTSPQRFLEETGGGLGATEEKRKEDSTTVRPNAEGKVDWVVATEGKNGNRILKVRTRHSMEPLVGDKFADRNGQKGIVGLKIEEENMPWSESGVVPDVIFNSHAIPSRMSAGFLLEALASKKASMEGEKVNATAFDNESKESIEEALKEHGFTQTGKEVMYDGKTGKRIEAKIFNGIVYYQRLHHLVSKKMHARASGPRQILTRQPTEGRARGGGQRLGHMERNCFVGHGTSLLQKERMTNQSDKTTELICQDCGSIAMENKITGEKYCESCGSNNVEEIEMSYGFKLLTNELKSLTIHPKLDLEDKA